MSIIKPEKLPPIAAIKGRLGNTDYYVIVMKAKDLVEITEIPSEMSGWNDMKLEEREQRDIDLKRVKEKIAPYLANHNDRFFGSIILNARIFDPNSFELMTKVAPKMLPHSYASSAETIGFLTLDGKEKLIPLDGQHRLKAIQFAITGKDDNNKDILGVGACSDLANEDVTVILVHHNTQNSRKIFTRVNSYAKPTGKGQNLVTDDEDFVAISARMIANNQEIIGPNLVKYKNNSNTLSDNERYFTTLATIANCNKAIIDECFQRVGSPPLAIDNKLKQEMYMRKINAVWKYLTENIKEFSVMLADKTSKGDKKRIAIRKESLLGKPVPQLCLFKAFIRLINSNRYTSKEAGVLLNKIDWNKDAKLWDRLLMSGSKIIPTNRNIAARIIYYVAGGSMDEKAKESLLKDYQKLFPDGKKPSNLPKKVRLKLNPIPHPKKTRKKTRKSSQT